MRYITSLIVCVALLFGACAQGQQAGEATVLDSVELLPAEDQQLLKDIAQMLVVGFRGTEVSDTCHIVRDIRHYGIGGVILFEYDAPSGSRPRNITSPDQLRRLCADLQSLGHGKLLISIDQEGGMVNRLKERYGFPSFASAQQTALGGDDSVRRYARTTAEVLNSLGINLNYAPCVDVNVNPYCPVIGKIERSFSADPRVVARCAEIWIDEQRAKGVISCLKHFPGHGSSKKDTHAGLADVSTTWMPLELEPYKLLIASGKVDMIMTTHVFNAKLDDTYPATLSKVTLTSLLRDSLRYDGVIVTDDLAMGAMVKEYPYNVILEKAINAGADMLCLSNNGKEYNADIVPQTLVAVYRLVKEGMIPRDRIADAARRVQRLKEKL